MVLLLLRGIVAVLREMGTAFLGTLLMLVELCYLQPFNENKNNQHYFSNSNEIPNWNNTIRLLRFNL